MLRNYAIFAVVLLAFVIRISWLDAQLRHARDSERRLALEASNLHAQNDTTARVALLLGDSLHAYEKLVVQNPQRRNRLDEATGVEPSGAYHAGVQVKSLESTVAAPRLDTTQFHIRQEPFTVHARVSFQPASDSMMLAVVVAVDSIPISLRIGCRDPGPAGVREASVVLLTPPWAAVRFGEVDQDPAICNPALRSEHETSRRHFSWAPIALSLGRTIGPGPSGWTAQLGTAIVFGAR